jgi:glutathione S-transferase
MEWINFISTEIHKSFGPLFNPETPEATKQNQKTLLGKRFGYLAEQLKGKQFLMGETFTVADAYLFTVLNWTNPMKIDLAPWPILQTYMARVATRPAVNDALKAEGLVK